MSKVAIILGASGLTGSLLVQKLISDDRYLAIKLFVRSKLNLNHSKVEQFVVDLMDFESFSKEFQGDEVYCCIGTTKKKTPDEALYRKIDFGIPVAAARLCKSNGIDTLTIISSVGANETSSNFYLKTKGEMEKAVLALEVPNTFIMRPSLIVGNRDERRGGEKFSFVMMRIVNPIMLGGLKKYRSITADKIADAMIVLANSKQTQSIFESNEIEAL